MKGNDFIITAKNLCKEYNGRLVVDNLNLFIKRGEIYGLLGPNGAGKSTIILMLLGLTEPSSGTLSVAGFNSTKQPLKVKRITGYLPEKVGFYEDITAKENLAYTAELNNIDYNLIPKKIDEVLKIVGLEKNKNQLVKQFSKGMKQRLGIADVLIKDPQVVIFDEPTEGLDVEVANQILNTITNLNEDREITFLLSSHQLNLVQKVCHRVGILSKGRLIGEGNIDELGRTLFGSGRYRIEIELAKPSTEIAEKIKGLDEVISVEQKENTIQITSNKDLRAEISKIISKTDDALLTKMNIKEYALDEIYLKYFKEE